MNWKVWLCLGSLILFLLLMWLYYRRIETFESNSLSELKSKIVEFQAYLTKHHPRDKRVKRINENMDPENIKETDVDDPNTSYTVEKGEEIRLCLKDKKTGRYHDQNLLFFVAVHEMAHVASKTFGHNTEFLRNFRWLLNEAVRAHLYVPENYSANPQNFCGTVVNESPLF